MTRFHFAVVGFAVLVVASSVRPAVVLSLDGSRTGDAGEPGDDRFLGSNSMVDATQILLDAGFAVGATDRFTAANIAGADVLYTGAVDVAFTAQELVDVETFVAAGGGLVIQRDWDGFYPEADPLAAVFGVTYDPGPEGPPAPALVLKIQDHPIWDGPGGATDEYLQQFSSAILAGGIPIGEHFFSGNDALSVVEFGLGRVVLLTDMDAWDSIGDAITPVPGNDNGIVWENIFQYAAGMQTVEAPLDIKPGSCPNSFNRRSNGVLPVALLGTDAFDVTQVDLASVTLSRTDGVGGAVRPNEGPPGPHSVLEDVATPFEGAECDCHELEGDGLVDLSMKFRTRPLVQALELDDLAPGELVPLEITGVLVDGTEFVARDCIRLVPKRRSRRGGRR